MEKNKAMVKGTVVHIFETPKKKILAIGVTKRRKKDGWLSNYPKVIFFKDSEGKTPADDVKELDKVEITGWLQQGHIKKTLGDRNIFIPTQSIVGGTLVPADDGMHPISDIQVEGTVVGTRDMNGKVLRVFVKNSRNGERTDKLMFTLFPDDIGKSIEELAPGTKVFLFGEVQTNVGEKDGEKMYMENIVVDKYHTMPA